MGDQELFTLIIVSIFIMVSLAIAVLVIYNISQNRILKEVEQVHIKEMEHQQKLLTNSIEVQESERARIAKDLHDEIGSKLNIVNLSINLLKGSIKPTEESVEILDQIESSLTDSIIRARDISHDLYPPILAKFGIQSAINSLANNIKKTKTLDVHLDIEHEWKSFTPECELHIYRILQELVNNTLKHAKASNIWISSLSIEDDFILIYKDDGVGINMPEFGNQNSGLGMSSIETRTKLLGAVMKVDMNVLDGYHVEFRM